MNGRRAKCLRAAQRATAESPKRFFRRLAAVLLPFGFGAVAASALTLAMVSNDTGTTQHFTPNAGGGHAQAPLVRAIDPNLIDPETMLVRKWRKVASLNELLKLSPEELEKVDIAEMNLLCATGLPGAENLNICKVLTSLEGFTSSARYQTNRHLYRVNDPKHADHYKHSENVLRAEFMVQVLQEDCGVHYNLQRVRDLDFTNSQDLFIHGLTGTNGGTCSSMPVLYVAISRRLGYPVSLALAPGHILARWDAPEGGKDPMKHFNMEGSGYGFSANDDEHYRNWPRKMTALELKSGFYLRPLTAAETLGVFLTTRGHCLLDIGRFEEARKAYGLAQNLSSKHPYLAAFIRQADSHIKARQYARAMKGAATQPVAASRPQYRPRNFDEQLRHADAINAYNRQLMDQYRHPPTPQPPYGPSSPQPGVPNPNQPYRLPAAGQPQG